MFSFALSILYQKATYSVCFPTYFVNPPQMLPTSAYLPWFPQKQVRDHCFGTSNSHLILNHLFLFSRVSCPWESYMHDLEWNRGKRLGSFKNLQLICVSVMDFWCVGLPGRTLFFFPSGLYRIYSCLLLFNFNTMQDSCPGISLTLFRNKILKFYHSFKFCMKLFSTRPLLHLSHWKGVKI